MPLLASEAMKPKLCGPLMSQRENATGIDPTTCSEDPFLRPETVTTTRREIPCIARRPVTRSVTVAPGPHRRSTTDCCPNATMSCLAWLAALAGRSVTPRLEFPVPLATPIAPHPAGGQ